jgi:hypothetical protein
VNYRADLLNLRTGCKFKLPHLTGGGADQAAAVEKWRTLVPSCYCLYSLYNNIRDKGKIVSAGY